MALTELRRTTGGIADVLIAGLALGCATSRIDDDIAAVRALSGVSDLMLPSDDVAVDIPADVTARLEGPLTAPTAVWIALHNSRVLRARLRTLGAARGQLVSAQSVPSPTLEVELWEPSAPDRAVDVSLTLEWDLSEAILAGVAASVARTGLDEARLTAAAEVIQGGYQVRAAFYAARSAADRWMFAAQALDTYAADVDGARALAAAGNISDLRLAAYEAAYEMARSEASLAELESVTSREVLNDLLGLHGSATGWTFAGAPPLPASVDLAPDLERTALEASLELRAARARSEGFAGRLGFERTRGWLPSISLLGLGEQREEGWAFGGGLRIGLPLFDQNRGEIAVVEAGFQTSLERLHGEAVSVRASARRLRARLQVSHARAVHAVNVLVPAKRRVLDEMVAHHNAMQVDVFKLLGVHREVIGAEVTASDAVRDFWEARAAMDALMAGARVDGQGFERRMGASSRSSSVPTGDGH